MYLIKSFGSSPKKIIVTRRPLVIVAVLSESFINK